MARITESDLGAQNVYDTLKTMSIDELEQIKNYSQYIIDFKLYVLGKKKTIPSKMNYATK